MSTGFNVNQWKTICDEWDEYQTFLTNLLFMILKEKRLLNGYKGVSSNPLKPQSNCYSFFTKRSAIRVKAMVLLCVTKGGSSAGAPGARPSVRIFLRVYFWTFWQHNTHELYCNQHATLNICILFYTLTAKA